MRASLVPPKGYMNTQGEEKLHVLALPVRNAAASGMPQKETIEHRQAEDPLLRNESRG